MQIYISAFPLQTALGSDENVALKMSSSLSDKVAFFSDCFQDFFIFLSFQKLNSVDLGVYFSVSITPTVHSAS